ncbi:MULTISPECIES: SRPBCC family protein [Microbacterium]|uniref:SRPBCC family protein n=1 Tax=Microbacterium TaxID=33882 RepID=UPI00051A010C|nr:SRPBCC family protein [Microbacterium profundi]
MVSRFTVTTQSSAAPSELFDISLDIEVHVASMAGTRERAIDGVTDGRIRLGEEVTWRGRHLGVWFTMSSRVTELSRPRHFVDEQTSGPFRAFRHEHFFEATPGGGCRMTDDITFASPIFGLLAERLILLPYLRRLIVKRNVELLRRVE